MGNVYHISPIGNDQGSGVITEPFRTISRAAKVALPGDHIVVHNGVYREWVDPQNGGTNPLDRIVYEAAPGEHPVIKGSELVTGWTEVEPSLWRVSVPNQLFGTFHPYQRMLEGDWFVWPNPRERGLHLGTVYLNDCALYEAADMDQVRHPTMRTDAPGVPWTGRREQVLHPEESLRQWYAEVTESETIFYANFQGIDPNHERTEISVRPCCFYPTQTGRNYITVRGFELAQAASPWAPPTGNQMGLIGPHWSKGWIIEKNFIHDARCCGISLGKDGSTGDNLHSHCRRKPGYQYQLEAVFLAKKMGWGRETVGSHVIRDNVICRCGQAGIAGHLGGVFCEISNNEIYEIATRHEFFGHEIAGIKLHAAIDVQIRHNYIHHCSLGTWLDWQAQGARISKNLYCDNDRDLMVEVTHGPYLVDQNIFGSFYNFDNQAQGGAYLHNLCLGTMRRAAMPERSTPYHFPHSTEIAGCAVTLGGDDRFYHNIFVGGGPVFAAESHSGTGEYSGSPTSLEEYTAQIKTGTVEEYAALPQPVSIKGNVYLNGAESFDREEQPLIHPMNPEATLIQNENGTVELELTVPAELEEMKLTPITTEILGFPRFTEAPFETPDGKPLQLTTDYLGQPRGETPVAGPLESLHPGKNKICLWKRTCGK